jgi:hypothetical protein
MTPDNGTEGNMAQRRRSSAKKQDDEVTTADDRVSAGGGSDAAVDGPGEIREGASATPSLSREEEARLRRKLRAKYH